jgi:hypothetical protein
MKKILICISLLTAFTVPIMGFDFDTYMKFTTGAWWMKSYRFYDDTTGYTIEQSGDTTYHVGPYPFPKNTGDFLTYGTLGFKAKGDRFESVVEIGIHKNIIDAHKHVSPHDFYYKTANSAPYLKKWYFNLIFNDYFSVLGGQDFALSCFFPSRQVFLGHNSFNNIGCLYTGRYPMVKLSLHHPDEAWKAQVAAIKQDTSMMRINVIGYHEDWTHTDTIRYVTEVFMPKLEASFEFNIEAGNFSLANKSVGGIQINKHAVWNTDTLLLNNPVGHDPYIEKQPSSAYVFGNDLQLKFGPVGFAVDFFWGQNLVEYGAYIGDAFGWWFLADYMHVFTPYTNTDENDKSFLNSNVFEISSILNVKPIDWLIFEGGAGYILGKHEHKPWGDKWNPTFAWYFQTQFVLYEKLQVTPEIGQYDYGPEDGFGKYFYWGFDTFIEF